MTKVGANDQEADASQSKRDFLAKYGIVKKELKETNYWLRLTADVNPKFKPRMEDLIKEGKEILLVVSSIIVNTRKSKKARRKNLIICIYLFIKNYDHRHLIHLRPSYETCN